MSANLFQQSQNEDQPSSAVTRRKSKSMLANLPGGGKATCVFFLSLIAYTLQTEFAQYVQQSLGYRKPFLSLYLGHSGFILLFPMHLLFLKWTTSHPISHYLHLISQNLRWQLDTPAAPLPDPRPDAFRRRLSSASGRGSQDRPASDAEAGFLHRPVSFLEQHFGFNVLKLAGLFGMLTIGITIPALSWYSAVPMTSMADITAIYNTFSVWALVFSVWFLGEKWERRKVFSVLLACFGVVVVAYGGAEHRRKPKPLDPVHGKPTGSEDPTAILITRCINHAVQQMLPERESDAVVYGDTGNPILGDFLAFFGAVTMAAYEMAFKLLGTLPDETKQGEQYSAVPGGLNRRSRSYVRYQNPDATEASTEPESQALLQTSTGATHDDNKALQSEPHILRNPYNDDDANADKDTRTNSMRSDSLARPRSSMVDKLIDHERTDYNSITPPPELSSLGVEQLGDTRYSSKDLTEGVRVLAKRVSLEEESVPDESEDDQATESELGDGEEDLVRSGATRLQRTRSQLSSHRLSSATDTRRHGSSQNASQRPGQARRSSSYRPAYDPSIPPPLPFGLHSNVMTAGIGLTTFSTFWIGIPIANALGWEVFEWPHNLMTWFGIFMVVFCGIFFNAAFMILLSLWGPVLASVSCLMTTILVEIADVLLGHKLKWVSVVGCALIGAGFAVLVGGDASH